MRIGIDIDNCISNFDDTLLKEYLKHDKELRNTGIINENPENLRKGMFDWTEEEEKSFYNANIENFARKLKPIEDSSYYIKKLKNDGHEIYIITGRDNGEYTNPHELTKEWLDKYDIVYDKLIFTDAYDKHSKTVVCLENNIDLMIEDSTKISLDLISNGIKVYTMNTRYNQKEQTLDRVSKWKEIYERISKLSTKEDNNKVNVILDTDIYNECDDQFALSYLLKSQDKFNIEAITVAPYHHENNISIEEGTDKSYNEIIKICNWLNFDLTNKVFKGLTDYVVNGYSEENDAVNKIIEIANKKDKTYILAIGAITNIALAIKKEPNIIDKIEVIWLGGHSFLSKDNKEFNFKQDIQAVRTVFESKVKLTIIPCKNVASNLRTSIYELEHFLKGKSVLFVLVPNLIIELKEAMSKSQLTAYKRKFEKYDLVILDELGYVSFDKEGCEILFNLLSNRNDKGSIIITTNLTFDRWEEIFKDAMLTGAMVDRLAYKAHILDLSRNVSHRYEETVSWKNSKNM